MNSSSNTGLGAVGGGTGKYAEKTGGLTESQLTTKAMRTAQARYKDAVILKIGGGGFQRAGLSDVYFGYEGVSIWVEFKLPGGDTTALQHRFLQKLKNTDVYCGVADSVECFLQIIEDALRGKTM